MRFHDSFLKLINTEAKRKIIHFLLQYDSAMSEREISSLVGISHMTVNRVLGDLEQWNFVSYERVGRAHVWRVNRQSYAYQVLQAVKQSIDAVSQPIEVLKKDILKGLSKKNLLRVVLFGSIAKNSETMDSDIDLFVLTYNNESLNALEKEIQQLSSKCLEKFGNRLSPYVLTEKQLKQKQHLKLIKEIDQGVQLFPVGG